MNVLSISVLLGMSLTVATGQQASEQSESEQGATLFHPPSKYIEVHGANMHYVEMGEGDPILFLHGNPDNLTVWRNIIPDAAKAGRAIAVDLIGMGKSDVADIEYRFFDHVKYLDGLIEKLGLQNLTLVGHDWGGTLAFHYAREHETNVKGIIFMETGLGPIPSWDVFPAAARPIFQQFRTPGVGWKLIVEQNALGNGPRTIRQLNHEELGHYRQPLADPARRKPVWRFVHEIPIAGEPQDMHEVMIGLQSWLMKTDLPKLLFHTTPGLIIGQPLVNWCQQNLKNLKIVQVGPGFHYPQEENPELIGDELIEWLRRP